MEKHSKQVHGVEKRKEKLTIVKGLIEQRTEWKKKKKPLRETTS